MIVCRSRNAAKETESMQVVVRRSLEVGEAASNPLIWGQRLFKTSFNDIIRGEALGKSWIGCVKWDASLSNTGMTGFIN